MSYARIAGTGSYLPEKVLTNQDLEQMVDTTHQWIIERTGIERRHIANDVETPTYMGIEASRRAIEMAGVDPEDIDLIIAATATPEYYFPSTACMLQKSIKSGHCVAFDMNAACSGFIYGLSAADKWVSAGAAKCALVVGTEALSRIVDWNDRSTCVLFADGAGAAVLVPDEHKGIYSTSLHANGNSSELLYAPHHISNSDESPYIKMNGGEVFKLAVTRLSELVEDVLQYHQIDHSDIDWLVPHQANWRIIKATAKKLGLPMDNVVVTIQDHGNTSAASIPLALDQAVRDGRVQKGHKLMFEAFGAGFTWASAYLEF